MPLDVTEVLVSGFAAILMRVNTVGDFMRECELDDERRREWR